MSDTLSGGTGNDIPPIIYPSPDYYISRGDIPTFTFDYVDVKQELVDALKNVLPAQDYADVKVLKADPQTQAEVPCIGINRVADDEAGTVLADTIAEPEYDPVTKIYTVHRGTYFQESVELRIWHTNADIRDKLYAITKATCLALRERLTCKGLRSITFRGGKDEQDTQMLHAPVPIYWASITLSFMAPLNINITSIEQIISVGDGVPNGVAITP